MRKRRISKDVIAGLILLFMFVTIVLLSSYYTQKEVEGLINNPDFEEQQCLHLSKDHVYRHGECIYLGK